MTPPSASYSLGVDTGGTFTDAVVFDPVSQRVIAAVKKPTTQHQLSIGIGAAIRAVVAAAVVDPTAITLVSLSTTLATNALVEGRGRGMCAVLIGFDDDVTARGGLKEALGDDPYVLLPGGHDPHGFAVMELDTSPLQLLLAELPPTVEAFAVTGAFSVRNPQHELAVHDLLRQYTNKPVSCSHQLSPKLDGPRRAVTAILNARLISVIDELLTDATDVLADVGIDAPLMVVRGDGSLVSARFVRERPIETILSGPAASAVGGAYLTGADNAMVADIGGTTTDVGILRNGVPRLDPLGATVGGHHTMVAAIAMHTLGLGGDSQVHIAASGSIELGPRRVVPVCVAASRFPEQLHALLGQHEHRPLANDNDAEFVLVNPTGRFADVLSAADLRALDQLPAPVADVASVAVTAAQRKVLNRLARRGAVQLCGLTPTDACHVRGTHTAFDGVAAQRAADLVARRRDARGRAFADNGSHLAQLIVDTVVRRSTQGLLAAAFAEDGLSPELVGNPLVGAALDGTLRTVAVHVGLTLPILAAGAAAPLYYPAVAARLGTTAHIAAHSDVANAVGAVVGHVRLEHETEITSPTPGVFVANLDGTQMTYMSFDDAQKAVELHLRQHISQEILTAGSDAPVVTTAVRMTTVPAGSDTLFVSATVTATAIGRPRQTS